MPRRWLGFAAVSEQGGGAPPAEPCAIQAPEAGAALDPARQEQRDRLLRAVIDPVGERGHRRALVAELSARSGVPRKTFYELFESKEDALLAAFDVSVLHLRDIVAAACQRPGAPAERVQWALEVIFEWGAREPGVARLCLIEVPAMSHAGRARRQVALGWLIDSLATALADLDPPALLPELLVGGAQEIVVRRVLADDTEALPALAPRFIETWLTGLDRPA